MYLSKMLNSVTDVFQNAISNHKSSLKSTLKYIAINLHDTNISNLLRHLGYFDQYSYGRFVRFSSSVRFELIYEKKEKKYKVRIVFDNIELDLMSIEKEENDLSWYYDFESFRKAFDEKLEKNSTVIESYCGGNMGTEYVNELQYRK